MKRLIVTIIGLVVGIVGLTASAFAQTDPAAKKILDAVSTKFKTFKGVQSGFSLKVEDGKGKVQGSEK